MAEETWLRDLNSDDRGLIRAIHLTVADLWPEATGRIKEATHGFTMSVGDLPDEIDLRALSDLVSRFKPRINEATVFWTGHSLALNIDVVGFGKSAFFPVYSPVDEIPTHVNEALAATGEFDIRMTPDWPFVGGQVNELAAIVYSRGLTISVPLTLLVVEQGKPTWVEFENTERITYSFLEYLSTRVHIANVVAKAAGSALCFEIASAPGPQLLENRA